MTKLCGKGHEDLTEGEHKPEICPWPGCPHGPRNGDVATTYWTEWGPTTPVVWGEKPRGFQPNVERSKEWRRQQGWRPNSHEMWRWVEVAQ